MDPLRVLTSDCGFFTRQEAKSAGYADRQITQLVRSRTWLRIRRGAYVFADEWALLDEVGRHRVRSSAVLRALGSAVALSHVSGVVRHGIDVWGLPLNRVHVTRLDGGPGRIEGDVVHHEGLAFEEDVVKVAGELVLRPERCVLEAGSRASNEVSLCIIEAGLRAKAFDLDALHTCHEALQFWPFMRHQQVPVRMADPRSGSIGESRGNWLFRTLGIPRPISQFEIRDANGKLLGITDWAWPKYRTFGEFDGKIKYGRLLKPGQEPGAVVFEEKRREDELREASGFMAIRFIWTDYERPMTMRSRLERILYRAS
jgi:hypothetical protein